MILIGTNNKYKYPIYAYLGVIYFEDDEIPNEELHVSIESTAGYCKNINCSKCPIEHECINNSPIYHFFPELKHTYPELFI